MKAILVVDEMPNSCDECEVRCDGYTAKEYFEKSIKRPSWCPLKPLPKAKEPSVDSAKEYWFACGFNDCLEEIEE